MPELNEALSKLWFCTAGLSANHTAHLAAVDLFSKAVNESNRGEAFGAAMCMTACSESWTTACTLAEAKSLWVIRTLTCLTNRRMKGVPRWTRAPRDGWKKPRPLPRASWLLPREMPEASGRIDGSREQISALRSSAGSTNR